MLSSKLGDDEDESEDDEDEEEGDVAKKAGQKYVAPKNVPKHFEEDKSKEEIQVMGFSVNFRSYALLPRLSRQQKRRSQPSRIR